MSNLVDHAKRELELTGEDHSVVEATLKMLQIFSDMGHSGASAHFHRLMLNELLQFNNLTPLTDNPSEWNHVAEEVWGEHGGIWQNARNSSAFSNDGGKTYYLLSECGGDGVKPIHESVNHLLTIKPKE